MNTLSNMSFLGQSTVFQGKIVRQLPKKSRLPKTVRNFLDNVEKIRTKSLKKLIEDNPSVASIYKEFEEGKINAEDAAKQVLDTIA